MWTPVILTAALALGQPGANLPEVPPVVLPAPTPSVQPALAAPETSGAFPTLWNVAAPADQTPAPIQITAPLLPPPPAPPALPSAPAAAPPPEFPPYLLMRELQGTYVGGVVAGDRLNIYGWTEGSYTYARSRGAWPIVAQSPTDEFLLNQNWLVFERPVMTTGTLDPTYGFHTAFILPGADARYTVSRGLLDHQHGIPDLAHSSYPIDIFHAYAEAYYPTIARGLDVKIGKNAVPYFAETEDKVYNPLFSHSYIFYYGGPFTHTGVQANLTLTPEWSIESRLVLGEDIAEFDGAQPTYVGALSWTQSGGRNTALLSVVIDSGRFDYRHPYDVLGTPGQNNVNLVDLVFNHNFNPVLKYTLDTVFGYETNVQGASPTGANNAIWYGAANYLTYTMSPRLAGTVRFELFDDEEGLRTGFLGLYTEATAGLTFKPRGDVWIRPEVRYDYNGNSRAFNNNHDSPQHDQLSAACDLILRW
jgi:hypothetical protein